MEGGAAGRRLSLSTARPKPKRLVSMNSLATVDETGIEAKANKNKNKRPPSAIVETRHQWWKQNGNSCRTSGRNNYTSNVGWTWKCYARSDINFAHSHSIHSMYELWQLLASYHCVERKPPWGAVLSSWVNQSSSWQIDRQIDLMTHLSLCPQQIWVTWYLFPIPELHLRPLSFTTPRQPFVLLILLLMI